MLSDSGKPTRLIVRALGDSVSQARRKRDRLVVICGKLFDRAKAGEEVTPEQIKTLMNIDLDPLLETVRRETAAGRKLPSTGNPRAWTSAKR
jgi:hypothetical protein